MIHLDEIVLFLEEGQSQVSQQGQTSYGPAANLNGFNGSVS